MRLGQFTENNNQYWCGAVLSEDEIVKLSKVSGPAGVSLPQHTTELLNHCNWLEKVEIAVEYATEHSHGICESGSVNEVAPVMNPGKIVCVGLNYRDHAEEGNNPIPDSPVIFSKFPTAIIGPNSTIRWDPNLTGAVDYEAELVAIIGKEARYVERENALDYVAGFTVGNDISARDIQHGDGQWVRGKSLDTFAPIGPEIVLVSEIDDPHDLEIWAEINGDRLQDSTTANFIFGIDELISFCSQAFTLHPGDLVFTGTPSGVGHYRDPPIHLEEGTSVTVGIEGIGTLTNTCEYID